MDSLLSILLFGLVAIVLFVSSFMAKIFKAKRYRFYWMIMTWAIAFIAIVAANIYQLDGLYALLSGIIAFVLSLLIVNNMKITAALTTALASVALLGLSFVGVVYALQESGSDTRKFTTTALELVPESKFYDVSVLQESEKKETELLETEETVIYSDSDLLPSRVITQPVIKSQIYREVNPRKAASMQGAMIRLLKKDGKTVKGNIVEVRGNKLIIGKYIPAKGVIRAPIPFTSIKKLEVMGH